MQSTKLAFSACEWRGPLAAEGAQRAATAGARRLYTVHPQGGHAGTSRSLRPKPWTL